MPVETSLTQHVHARPEYLGGPHAGGTYPADVTVDADGIVSR